MRADYALGWYVGRAADGSPRHSHGGSVRGFTCEFRRYPEHDACVAVLTNTDDARPWEVADGLEKLLLGRGAPSTSASALLSAEEELACAGVYGAPEGRLVVRAAPGVLEVGVEGAALLARLGADEKLEWKADREEFTRRAVAIVDGIGRGDTSTLRDAMAKRIPAGWPDTMRRSIWPAELSAHGAYRGVFPLGARSHGGRVEVLLAVEHEQRMNHALVAFSPAGLELLDWDGPAYLAAGRLERVRRGVFELRLGADATRLEFKFDKDRASEVRLGSLKLERE